MPRKNISEVIDAFKAGGRAQHATCRTDGTTIWSYDLPIATRLNDGTVAVRKSWSSPTTQGQINAVAKAIPECARVDAILL